MRVSLPLGRQTGICVQIKFSSREPIRLSAPLPDGLLPRFRGVLVALLLVAFEAHLAGMSLVLFPGVEPAGSASLRPMEGCRTSLPAELFSETISSRIFAYADPWGHGKKLELLLRRGGHLL